MLFSVLVVVNEDAFISGTNLPKQTGLNLGNQTTPLGDLQNPSVIGNAGLRDWNEVHPSIRDDPVFTTSAPMEVDHSYNPDISREQAYSSAGDVGSGPGKMARLPMEAPKTEIWDPLPASTVAIDSEPQRGSMAEPVAKIGPLTDLEKDLHAPGGFSPPNYQTKVVDPTGKGRQCVFTMAFVCL